MAAIDRYARSSRALLPAGMDIDPTISATKEEPKVPVGARRKRVMYPLAVESLTARTPQQLSSAHRRQLATTLIVSATALLKELAEVIVAYACDPLGCSYCRTPYVGRPYQCWVYLGCGAAGLSGDLMALLTHCCSVGCALSVPRNYWDPRAEDHVALRPGSRVVVHNYFEGIR